MFTDEPLYYGGSHNKEPYLLHDRIALDKFWRVSAIRSQQGEVVMLSANDIDWLFHSQ